MNPWDVTWEARYLRVADADESPWLVCVSYSWHDLFLAQEVLRAKPTTSDLWNILVQALRCSEREDVPCPRILRVEKDNEGWEALRDRLKQIGIKLVRTHDMDYPDGFPEWIDREWQKWEHRKDSF